MAVLVGRANKPSWARAEKLRGDWVARAFVASPLSSASDKTAMLRRLKYLASILHSFFLKFGLTLGEIDLL